MAMAMAVASPLPLSSAIASVRLNRPLLSPNCTISTSNLNNLKFRASTRATKRTSAEPDFQAESLDVDCVGTGLDVECVAGSELDQDLSARLSDSAVAVGTSSLAGEVWEWALLVSPFFFWGTAMVAMKEVLPKTGPFFVSSFRLIPAGLLLVAFATSRGRPLPSGVTAWLAISLFGLVDATCFQGFLAAGLEKTSAGLGSVIIDSQPLTVAVLAALLFGESIGFVGAAGLILGVIGLLLLEVPALSFDDGNFSLWGSGEWWMLLAAQSMAVGTVMVRWVSTYADPVMATGWHMVIGGLPLVVFSTLNHDPALNGGFMELKSNDLVALLYTSLFGSAISYGVAFGNWKVSHAASVIILLHVSLYFLVLSYLCIIFGSLTKLSSLTFLTPMFASIFGFLYLGEAFSPVQLVGAFITLAAIYMVNYKNASE